MLRTRRVLGAAYLWLTRSNNVNTSTRSSVSPLFMSTLASNVHLAFYCLSGLRTLAEKLSMPGLRKLLRGKSELCIYIGYFSCVFRFLIGIIYMHDYDGYDYIYIQLAKEIVAGDKICMFLLVD